MKLACLALLLAFQVAPAQGTQTFTGVISDDVCPKADHSGMRMGSNDAECTTECVDAHGANYVLFDGKNFFKLVGTQSPRPFAGQKARVVGELDTETNTIRVESIVKP